MAQINLTQLNNAFVKAYMRYYNNGDAYDYQEMYDKGCKLIDDPQMVPLLSDFARYRQDYITSDREVAAFAKAYTMCTKQEFTCQEYIVYGILAPLALVAMCIIAEIIEPTY